MSGELQLNSPTLALIGSMLRKLLLDLLEEFDIPKTITGVCFRPPDQSGRAVFAEWSRPDETPAFEATLETRYFFVGDDPFLANLGAKEGVGELGDISGADEDNVLRPILAVFSDRDEYRTERLPVLSEDLSAVTQYLRRFSIPIGTREEGQATGACIFYSVYDQRDLEHEQRRFLRQLKALAGARGLLGNVIRQALHFSASSLAHADAEHIRACLDGVILDDLATFSESQQIYLQSILHPAVGGILVPMAGEEEVVVRDVDDEDEWRMCAAIRVASEIRRLEYLGGSFRGKNVLLVEVKPRASEAAAPKTYRSVVKSVDRTTALREQTGLNRLWGYSDVVGKFLPQNPLFFPYRAPATDLRGTRFAAMTPHVAGAESLFDFAREKWFDDKLVRAQAFGDVFRDAMRFLEGIRGGTPTRIIRRPNHHLYAGLLGQGEDPERRRMKLTEIVAWPRSLSERSERKSILLRPPKGEPFTIVNPLYVLRSGIDADQDGSLWKEVHRPLPHEDEIVTFGHGDFHAGNLLIEFDEDMAKYKGLVVLDFDYVDEKYSKYYDPATIETSFVLAVARGFDNRTERWLDRMFPALLRLYSPSEYGDRFENHRFAFDLWKAVSPLAASEAEWKNPHFAACRCLAVLRLLASHYISAQNRKQLSEHRLLLWTAVIYAGLLLKWIVREEGSPDDDGIELDQLITEGWPDAGGGTS